MRKHTLEEIAAATGLTHQTVRNIVTTANSKVISELHKKYNVTFREAILMYAEYAQVDPVEIYETLSDQMKELLLNEAKHGLE